MNKKIALSVLVIFAIFAGAAFVNVVSAGRAGSDDLTTSTQASTTLVISQVYGGGGGTSATNPPTYLNDYVELFNVSTSPISLNGLALQYGSSSGQFGSSATNIYALPAVTVQPGQHYFVQLGSAGTAGGAFPITPDTSTTNLNLSAASGKVALTNTTTGLGCGATATPCTLPNSSIIDLVSYGASNNGEGNTTVNNGTALTSTQGAVRAANGCTDTDNNNLDFTVVTAPVPRNTSSTATPCGGTVTPTPQRPNADFNGDRKSDYVVTRNVGGNKAFYVSLNGQNNFLPYQVGLDSDTPILADFDGDGKADIAVWRSAPAFQAAFYILRSSDSTMQTEVFGQTGDIPSVTADYDGDGKADPAIYRNGATGQTGIFAYRGSLNNTNGTITVVNWGTGPLARPYTGDFNGDGKADFCVNDANNGQQQFLLLTNGTNAVEFIPWGLATDQLAPGDYDADGKTDFCVVRNVSGQDVWYIYTRSGATSIFNWGLSSDQLAPGDYDGDGKADPTVFRDTSGAFYTLKSSDGGFLPYAWGTTGDKAAASWITRP